MVLLVWSWFGFSVHYAIPAVRPPGWRATGTTGGPALSHQRTAEFQHGLGEIVTSLVEAGLRIEFLHKWDFELFRRFDSLERQEDGTYRLPAGQPRVPMMYSLRASMPGRRYATG
jgi:hypothetical protein